MFSLSELEFLVSCIQSSPTLEEMPRRRLQDKGIDGPTAAHVIEEVHVPLNIAYLTFTTGSSAFQNIVGVTYPELDGRTKAAHRALDLCGIGADQHMLVTYAPLVNVFGRSALAERGVEWSFLARSHRDALLLALCQRKPAVLLGESSFLRVTLAQAMELGLREALPKSLCLLTAGTPLDLDLLPVAEKLGYVVHDLYGCQEFGWLTLDGVPLRDDISLIASPIGEDFRDVAVGGLPMGDSFPYSADGHVCNRAGPVLTYKRQRTHPEYEVIVKATTRGSADLIERTARTILRIKGRVVKVSKDLRLNADETELHLVPSFIPGEDAFDPEKTVIIRGQTATNLFERMVEAQFAFQSNAKTDPTWIKRR
jgi:hypothetical protein